MWNVCQAGYSSKKKKETSILKLKEDLISQGLFVPYISFSRARMKNIKVL
jgi:hypothetical protein